MKSLREALTNVNEASMNDYIEIYRVDSNIVITNDFHEFMNFLVNERGMDQDEDFDEISAMADRCIEFKGKLSDIFKEISKKGYFER